MDGSFYGDLQSLEEFFTASKKPAISLAVVSTASTGDHHPLGIYQDEESVDLSALLEACNDASAPVTSGTIQQSYSEAIATNSDTFSFRNFCQAPTTATTTTMYGSENCLGMTNELPTKQDPPTPAMDRAPGKAPRPSKAMKKKNSDKNSCDYRHKRDKNNVAVRKSRQKTKVRVQETESRVQELEDENALLLSKIALLSKELNVLKSLFTSAGVIQPPSLRVKEEQ